MGLLTKAGYWLVRGLGLTDPRLYDHFTGGATDSGESVTVDSAMQLDTVWACVRRISETIATLPLHLYRVDREGRSIKATEHPLYRVLHDRPNVEMTAVEYWEAVIGCMLLWGNSYSAISRGDKDRVIALDPMRPDRVSLRRETDGSISYTYSWGGYTETFKEDQILHVKGFSLDGLCGISPVAQARNSLGHARAAQRASSAIFRNGLRHSAVLTSPTYLSGKQRADAQTILEKFTGAQNTGRVPLLEGGWTLTSNSIPPEDAQLLETQQFSVETICRWYDVPPILVGHSGQTTWGSGIEQIILGWLQLGLRSHLKRLEQAISKSLLTPAEQLTMYAEFNFEGLLRADSQGRATLMSAYAQNGLRTRNELRALDNEAPMEGGDELTVQSNLVPLRILGTAEHLGAPQSAAQPNEPVVAPSTTGANIPG